MTRLFFDEIRRLGLKVYLAAGEDETRFPEQSRTVLARKILELAIEQGRANLKASKQG